MLFLRIHAKQFDDFQQVAITVLPAHGRVECAVRKIPVKIGTLTSRLFAEASAR